MNIHHLELFYYVARHGGISRAVRRMPWGIQQPAVSGQMLQLEEAVGARLFERQPFRLTPEGEELYAFVQPFFGNLGEVEEKQREENDVRPAAVMLERSRGQCARLQRTGVEGHDLTGNRDHALCGQGILHAKGLGHCVGDNHIGGGDCAGVGSGDREMHILSGRGYVLIAHLDHVWIAGDDVRASRGRRAAC